MIYTHFQCAVQYSLSVVVQCAVQYSLSVVVQCAVQYSLSVVVQCAVQYSLSVVAHFWCQVLRVVRMNKKYLNIFAKMWKRGVDKINNHLGASLDW